MTVDSESVLLTVSEVADVLRTSRKAIYAMIERGQLPGFVASAAACSFDAPIYYTGSTTTAPRR